MANVPKNICYLGCLYIHIFFGPPPACYDNTWPSIRVYRVYLCLDADMLYFCAKIAAPATAAMLMRAECAAVLVSEKNPSRAAAMPVLSEPAAVLMAAQINALGQYACA